ncbi:Conserved_hypothetical protein [Hexamita inflata]|uniref:Uncharacterized protein n=1 Tax=Hexamita inflata TaxID=28002 RepID=A0AA86TZR3_9EUKA|nr:Conserved hypothetical protein [Hexamita inflata]CAI9934691.1 Conserved hypothetical protein [Hexamita inflata]
MSKLGDDMLMNVVKLSEFTFLVIQDNTITITNREKQILKQIRVDFDLYPGTSHPNYCYGKPFDFSPQLHQVVRCAGRIYLQYFDSVLELTSELTLKKVAVIPGLTKSTPEAFACRLFSLNGNLFAHNYNGSGNYNGTIYKLENGLFRRQDADISGHFIQFCDKVFVFDYKKGHMYQLTNNLERKLIKQLERDINSQMQKISFFGGGTLVLCASYDSLIVIIDLLTGNITENQNKSSGQNLNERFNQKNIWNRLTLGNMGLQMQEQEMVGDMKDREEYYHKFYNNPENQFQIHNYEVLYIIRNQQLQQFETKLQKQHSRITEQMLRITRQLSAYQYSFNKYTNSFVNLQKQFIDQ